MRRRCSSPKTTKWSTHSRRIDPISRSAKPFCNRRNYKEINRRDPVSVVVKEGLPCLRWSTLPRYHVLRDRRLGDVEAEPQKLAVDNRLVSLAPKRVFNAANGVSDLALDLVAFAFALELAVS